MRALTAAQYEMVNRRLRVAAPTARLLVEVDKLTNHGVDDSVIVDSYDEWGQADSLTGIERRRDGTIRLAGVQGDVVTSLAATHDGTDITDLDRISPHWVAMVSVGGLDRNASINRIIAHVDPDVLGTGRVVDQWRCQVFAIREVETIEPGVAPTGGPGDLLKVSPESSVVSVVESGTADHEVTFSFPQAIPLPPPPHDPLGAAYPNPTLLVFLRAITNSGAAATNVAWWTTNASSVGTTSTITALQLAEATDTQGVGRLRIATATEDVPLMSLGYLTFTDDLVEFVANPLDAGADPATNAEVRLLGHARVQPGTAVRFFTRNDADTGWVEYTDGQRATDLVNVTFTGAGHPRKFKVELDTNAASDVTPEVSAIGFQYVTTTQLFDVAFVEGCEWIVDPETLRGRVSEIRVRGIRDGVHDFNSAIEELLAQNHIADLAIALYVGHPDDDRASWLLIDTFPHVHDTENEAHSHVLVAMSPLAFLQGGPNGERRLPRYDTVAEEREELVYSGAAALNAPSEIRNDLLKVQLGISEFWVGAPPEDVTLEYLDDATPPVVQTLNLSTTTDIKKVIRDSEAWDEIAAVNFLAGHAETSSQGRIKSVRMRGGEGPIRAIFPAEEITWAEVSPGFRRRRPVLFTEYNFWDFPDDPDEVRSFHANAITNLGGGRIGGVDRLPQTVSSWMQSKALAEAIGAREIAVLGPGLPTFRFGSQFAYLELECGDRVAVEVTSFAARDPNVSRELRGALWVVGRIFGVHDPLGRSFTLHPDNWADIIASAKVVTRVGLDPLARVSVYHSTNQTDTGNVEFDSEVEDTHGFHDTATNSHRLTIPPGLGGIYDFSCHFQWSAYAGVQAASVYKNSAIAANSLWEKSFDANDGATGHETISLPNLSLVEGDFLFLNVFGDSPPSNTLTVVGGSARQTNMRLIRRTSFTRVSGRSPIDTVGPWRRRWPIA